MSVIISCVYVSLASPVTADTLSVREVQDRVVGSRSAIRSLHARCRIESGLGTETSPKDIVDYEVWWQTDKSRVDRLRQGKSDRSNGTGFREIVCNNCERPGHLVDITDGLSSLHLYSPTDRNVAVSRDGMFNPTLLGYSPFTISHAVSGKYKIDTHISSPVVVFSRVERQTVRGEAVQALHGNLTVLQRTVQYTVWVSPDKGYVPLRLELVTPSCSVESIWWVRPSNEL